MSQINVDTIRNRTSTNGGPTFDKGLTVSAGTTAYVYGNLQVDGTETIVNTERLDVADKTVGIASTTAASNSTADGAGIEVYGGAGGNKTVTWVNSTGNWTLGGGGLTADSAIVGSAVTVNGSGIKAGIITANSFVGDITGNVTGTASNASGATGDFSIADKIVHTGDTNTALRFPSADTITAETAGTKRLEIDSSGKIKVTGTRGGSLQPEDDDTLQLYTSASDNSINRGSGLTFYNHDNSGYEQGGSIQVAKENGTADNEAAYMRFNVRPAGATNVERLRITSKGAFKLDNADLVEKCYINSTAWSTNGDINLDNGMVHYNSANLAGTNNTLNITSSVGINTQMAAGDIISVTAITAVNATTAYVNHITIDHIAVTENWVGGSAPTDGGGSGLDTYAFNIIKTGSAAWKVIANQVKTS